MERIKREHTEHVLDSVVKMIDVPMVLSRRNGYFNIDLKADGSGRTLKSGTLRECDTFVRGMFEGLSMSKYGY